MNPKLLLVALLLLGSRLAAQNRCDENLYFDILTTADSTLEVLDIVPIDNGDVIAAAYYRTSDISYPILIKLRYNGERIWQKQLTIPSNGYLVNLTRTKDGNIVATGWISDLFNASMLVKFDTAGNVIWHKEDTYNTVENPSGHLIREDNTGNIYTVGSFIEGGLSFSNRFSIQKYDATGNLLWSKMITGGSGLTLNNVSDFVVQNGACYLVGHWHTGYFYAGVLLKVNATNGNLEWSRLYDYNKQEVTLYAILPAGNGFVLCGKNNINPTETNLIFETDANGQLLSTHMFTYPGIRDNEHYAIDDKHNIYYGVGYRKLQVQDRLVLAKFSIQTGIEWAEEYNMKQGYYPRISTLKIAGDKLFYSGGAYSDNNSIYGHVAQVSPAGEAACQHNPFSIAYSTVTGGSRDTTLFSVNKSRSTVSYNVGLQSISVNVNQACVLANNCESVQFDRDSLYMCSMIDTFSILFAKNAGCFTRVDFSYDPRFYLLVDQTDTRATFSALTASSSYLYATIRTACGNIRDSIYVVNAGAAIDVKKLPVLDRKLNSVLHAPRGFAFLWNDGTRADSLIINPGKLNRMKLVDPCGNVIADTVRYFPPGPGSFLTGQNVITSAIAYPNAFSPNGDGKNDFYKPLVRTKLNSYRLTIYNRAGRPVFTTTDVNKYWDGGSQPAGSYFFECIYTLQQGKQQSDRGTIVLVK